jgi:Right handed beta helix region
MKMNLNQTGVAGKLFRFAAGLGLLFFSASGMTAPVGLNFLHTPPPLVTTLSTNITSVEIQSALESLPDSGGEVILPAGEFLVTQPIILKRSHQTLNGAGDATILRLATNANCPVIILGEPVNNPDRTVKFLSVSNLFIDGNRHQQARELWKNSGEGSQIRNNGITVQSVSDSVVENVTCADCRSGGLVTTRDVRRLTVRHLTAFDNEFDGLACYQTEHSLFTDLYLHDNPGAGISLDLAFNHNVISNAVLVANDLGVFMRASRDNQFFNLSIDNSHHFGVFMANTELFAAGHVQPAPQTECADNAFTNLTATNCGGAAFRVNNITCTNNVIIRAQFAKNLKGGLSLAQPNLVMVQ